MSETSSQEKKSSNDTVRKSILFGVLFLLVIGLVYDYQVARPAVNNAYDKIVEQSMLVNMKANEVLTNDGVQELLQKQPSRTFEEANGDLVEVYSWRSGLPIRTHDLFAVYKKSGDKWMFYRHAKFKHESSTDVSQYDGKEALMIRPEEGTVPEEGTAESSDENEAAPEGTEPGDSEPEQSASAPAEADPDTLSNDNDEDKN